MNGDNEFPQVPVVETPQQAGEWATAIQQMWGFLFSATFSTVGSLASILGLIVAWPTWKGDSVLTLTADGVFHIILSLLLAQGAYAQFRAAWKIAKLVKERDAAVRAAAGSTPNPAHWPAATAIVVTDADVDVAPNGAARFTFRLYNRSPFDYTLLAPELGDFYAESPGIPTRWQLAHQTAPGGVHRGGLPVPAHGIVTLFIDGAIPNEHVEAVRACAVGGTAQQLRLGCALPREAPPGTSTAQANGLVVDVARNGDTARPVAHSLRAADRDTIPGTPNRWGGVPGAANTALVLTVRARAAGATE